MELRVSKRPTSSVSNLASPVQDSGNNSRQSAMKLAVLTPVLDCEQHSRKTPPIQVTHRTWSNTKSAADVRKVGRQACRDLQPSSTFTFWEASLARTASNKPVGKSSSLIICIRDALSAGLRISMPFSVAADMIERHRLNSIEASGRHITS